MIYELAKVSKSLDEELFLRVDLYLTPALRDKREFADRFSNVSLDSKNPYKVLAGRVVRHRRSDIPAFTLEDEVTTILFSRVWRQTRVFGVPDEGLEKFYKAMVDATEKAKRADAAAE